VSSLLIIRCTQQTSSSEVISYHEYILLVVTTAKHCNMQAPHAKQKNKNETQKLSKQQLKVVANKNSRYTDVDTS
jgi:hypothetical protein